MDKIMHFLKQLIRNVLREGNMLNEYVLIGCELLLTLARVHSKITRLENNVI